ncbi:MAG: hypothetical protein ACRCU3_00340 [Eubacteriaceae bacterium]
MRCLVDGNKCKELHQFFNGNDYAPEILFLNTGFEDHAVYREDGEYWEISAYNFWRYERYLKFYHIFIDVYENDDVKTILRKIKNVTWWDYI